MLWLMRRCRGALIVCLLGLSGPAFADAVTVFAAASLKTALDDAVTRWSAQTGTEVRLSFAGSSVLARQIAQGAPADLFVSANRGWMQYLADRGLIDLTTRRDLVGNTLVLVGAAGAPPVDLSDPGALPARLGGGRLAMALVSAVPAGIYGKAALEHLGIWAPVADRLAETDNVRAALALVAIGAAPLGVVYATDAAADPRVSVVAVFPDDSHPPVAYPAAATLRAGPQARALLDYLGGPEAAAIFARHGFRRGA